MDDALVERMWEAIAVNSPCQISRSEALSVARAVLAVAAPAIRAAEREACAEVAATFWKPAPPPNGSQTDWLWWGAEKDVCIAVAAAIRARKDTP